MSTTNQTPSIITFIYPESVFSTRLSRYLALRNIPHTQIRVPPNMPRPLLERLNINYRRIPIVSLGRSIYIDTRHILSKLETLIPDSPKHPTLGAKDHFNRAVEQILEGWVIDAGPFWRASGVLPPAAPLLRSEVWMQDRADGSGGMFNAEAQRENRAWCLSQIRVFMGATEGMLADGRTWLLGGEEPGLAELHAWAFDWVVNIAEDMLVHESEQEEAMKDVKACLSEAEFPRTYEWMRRWREHVGKKEATNRDVVESMEGQQAEDEVVKRVLASDFVEGGDLVVEEGDVSGFKKGQKISVGSADFGFTHSDVGELVGLTKNEVVIEIALQDEAQGNLRLHFPRVGFKILPVKD